MKNTYYRKRRYKPHPFQHTCVRCGHIWRSAKEHPRSCANANCKKTNWHRRPEHKYKIDPLTPIGGNLIFAPWVMYQAHNKPPEPPLPGMPRGCDTRFEIDQERARITQATIERKLKKMGIPFRYAVLPNGVMYIRTA